MPQNASIRTRRDTAANWTSTDPVLELGEAGLETDTGRVKYGDGVTAWSALVYILVPIHVGTAAPSSPVIGDLWVDTN